MEPLSVNRTHPAAESLSSSNPVLSLIYYELLAPLLSLLLSPLTHFIIYASLGLPTWEHHGEVIAK